MSLDVHQIGITLVWAHISRIMLHVILKLLWSCPCYSDFSHASEISGVVEGGGLWGLGSRAQQCLG